MGYCACLGIMSLAKTAWLRVGGRQRAGITARSPLLQSPIDPQAIADQQPVLELDIEKAGPHHGNVRGAQYYNTPPDTLLQ